MKTRTGTVVVTILSILGGILGFMGSSGWFATAGALDGFRAVCYTLKTAEAKAIVTKAQRDELAKAAMSSSKGDPAVLAYLSSDCAKSFFQYSIDNATKKP